MKYLLSLLLAVLFLIPLASCQNFSPKDPNVTSNSETTPQLKAFDFAAENWQIIKGEGISISLPKTYQGGNPLRDLTEIESALNSLGESYGRRLQSIRQNLDDIVLIAFDARSLTLDTLTNVNIIQQSLDKSISLADYLKQAVQQLEKTHTIEAEIITSSDRGEIARIVASKTTDNGVTMKQLFYFQPQEDTILISTFSTPKSEFQGRVANFEQSIASLAINNE